MQPSEIADEMNQVTDGDVKLHGRQLCRVHVFDDYTAGPSTKDTAQLLRSKGVARFDRIHGVQF